MNKIGALYVNEMIKISRKVSILVMILIMVIGVAGSGGMMKLQQSMMSRGDDGRRMQNEWIREEMKYQQERLSQEIGQVDAQLSRLDEQDPDDAWQIRNLTMQRALLEDQIAMYELAEKEDIMLLGSEDYLSQALYTTVDIRQNMRLLAEADDLQDPDDLVAYAEMQDRLEAYETVVLQRDFERFLDLEAAAIIASPDLSENERALALDRLELWNQLDPSGGLDPAVNTYQVRNVIDQAYQLQRSLFDRLDYTAYGGVIPLTPERYAELENQLAVLHYRIDNGLVDLEDMQLFTGSAIDTMFGFGTFMIVLMMLILAGGAVSQEIATGSIKSLIISPARRWKIFTAKLLSLVTVSLAALLSLYLFTLLLHGILFGFGSGLPYVYASQGQAAALGFAPFQLATLLVRWLDILIFIALALMLSVLTRNTAAAVGVSMAAFFGTSLIKPFLIFLPQAEWVKFLPFNNLGLVERFFPFNSQMGSIGYAMFGMPEPLQPSLLFSLVYLAVMLVCLLYTALDSFNRRDIK